MKPSERDGLLYRLDERTANIWRVTQEQEKHLIKLNDAILNHAVQINSNRANIKWLVRILIASGILGGSGAGIWRILS